MPFPSITALATAILVIILMGLGFYTSMGRLKHSQSLGHGGSDELERRMRSHGNLAEHAALILLCLALLEMSGARAGLVAVLAGWLVVARIAHPIGLMTKPGPNPLRFFGSASTYLIGALAGVWLLLIAFERMSS